MREGMPCSRTVFLKVLVQMLKPTHVGLLYWRASTGRAAPLQKRSIVVPLFHMTLELSATAIATLLQDRAARLAFRVLLPPPSMPL
jgi:hypothetical protein